MRRGDQIQLLNTCEIDLSVVSVLIWHSRILLCLWFAQDTNTSEYSFSVLMNTYSVGQVQLENNSNSNNNNKSKINTWVLNTVTANTVVEFNSINT